MDKDYRIVVYVELPRGCGCAEETIDLVKRWGFSEEEATDFIANGCTGNQEIEDAVADHAREMISHGCFAPGRGQAR
jgi:hypothetical protein